VLKAIHAAGFRAPSAAERALAPDSNPGLEPERFREQSLVLEGRLGPGLRIAGSLFRHAIRDRIGPSGGPMLQNLPSLEWRGAEAEVEKRWLRGRSLRVSWVYQEARDAAEDFLVNSPRHLGRVHAGLPFFDGRLVLGGEILYASRRLLLDGTETDGQLLANLTVTAPDLAPGLELSASFLNLLDEEYADPAAAQHAPLLEIPQNGRNARARLVWRF
jgi:outer membrane receptor protein involved in Fe transport